MKRDWKRSTVVPAHHLNKYGGVYTSELRDNRSRRRKQEGRWEDTGTIPTTTNSDIGYASFHANPAISSPEIQRNIYNTIFQTY